MKFALLSLALLLSANQGFAQETGLTIYKTEFYGHDHSPSVTRVSPDGTVKKTNGKTGTPTQIKVGATYSKEIEQGKISVQIGFPTSDSESGYFWGETVDSVDVTIALKNGEHKYFWFNKSGQALQLEYPARGASKYSPYLLKTLLRGNNHDMSKAVNGHMPSQLSQQALFTPDSLWIHDSSWGRETYRVVNMPELLVQFDTASSILTFMDRHFRKADKMDLLAISKKANNQIVLRQIESLMDWASKIDLVNTPIYNASVEMEAELHSK